MAWAIASDSIDRTRARASMRASASRSATSPAASCSIATRRRSKDSSPARIRLLLLSVIGSADGSFQSLEPLAKFAVLTLKLTPLVAQRRVVLPPVDAHFLRAVNRGDQQPDLDRQQLDVEQVDLDVARDHDPLVEHSFQNVGQVGGRGAPAAVEVRAPIGLRQARG